MCIAIYHLAPRNQRTTQRQLNEENFNFNIVKSGVRGVTRVCRCRFPGSIPQITVRGKKKPSQILSDTDFIRSLGANRVQSRVRGWLLQDPISDFSHHGHTHQFLLLFFTVFSM